MKNLHQWSKSALDQERSEVLQQLDAWLETPMLVLGFVWLGLFIMEMVWGLTPLLEIFSDIIWIAFIGDFGIQFLLAPQKLSYLKHNWLTAFSLLLPALRTLRIVPVVQSFFQSVHGLRGLQLLRVMTRINKGMKVLAASIGHRGFGYVVGTTTIVTLIGAAGIYTFERELPSGAIADYGTALWWTAMVMTTIGSDFFPKTAEGRVLCFFLSMYAFGVSGYLTATLATFFVSQDIESDREKLADTKSIQTLQIEISALRKEIQALAEKGL